MEMIIVEASPRSGRGKNAARRARVAGQVPAVIYGGKGESEALALNTKSAIVYETSASAHPRLGTELAGQLQKATVKIECWR